jgi:uncharacterized repeat protein (TIGR03803 family)
MRIPLGPKLAPRLALVAAMALLATPPGALGVTLHRSSHAATSETILYSFTGGKDGADPQAGLIQDASGALYGTATNGGNGAGTAGDGVVFKLTPSGQGYVESVLYAFRGGNDGAMPWGGVIADGAGALYGTTNGGGSTACAGGCGTVYRLRPAKKGYAESVIYRFQGGADGAKPYYGSLLRDASGALYGTTNGGGDAACGTDGCGVVFKLTRSGRLYLEQIVHTFHGGSDGAGPAAGLVEDAGGSLYGTTYAGGSKRCGGYGCGTVFALTPTASGYAERILHAFTGELDGGEPFAPLTMNAGALFGTTAFGGRHFRGNVFEMTPAGGGFTYTVLCQFLDGKAVYPVSGVIPAGGGALYGTTSGRRGTVYALTPSKGGYTKTVLHAFGGKTDGLWPNGTLIAGPGGGALFDTTMNGGAYGYGTVFSIQP